MDTQPSSHCSAPTAKGKGAGHRPAVCPRPSAQPVCCYARRRGASLTLSGSEAVMTHTQWALSSYCTG